MRVFRRTSILCAAAVLAGSSHAALAEVVDVANNGFATRSAVTLAAPPAKAWAALVDVGKWWDPEHTWSRSAANLSLEAKPQGCFCETLPDGGGVRHMTVVYAAPGKLLRLEGGLGPFQALGVSGVLTWTLQAAGTDSAVELTYVVSGYHRGGFQELAPIADTVLRSQLERFKRFVEKGKP